MPEKIKVLFICLGNICRSPLAEILFINHLKHASQLHLFEVDSCGTSDWHRGELADERTRNNAMSHELEITHRSRQITAEDYEYFDYLLVMDLQNLLDVKALNPQFDYKVALITDYADDYPEQIIPDPYFGEMQGFEDVFNLLEKVTKQVADTIIHQRKTKS